MRPDPAERVPEYLQHIVAAIDRAASYVAGLDFKSFERDTLRQDAVIRTIAIIGEAARKVSVADAAFATRNADVPWDLMYGMRNRIVHDYFEIDLGLVWQTVHQDLPLLRQKIAALIKPPARPE